MKLPTLATVGNEWIISAIKYNCLCNLDIVIHELQKPNLKLHFVGWSKAFSLLISFYKCRVWLFKQVITKNINLMLIVINIHI